VVNTIRDNCIDVSQLKEEQNFKQSAMFSACVIKDSDQSLAMCKMLVDFNCDPK
jgi:hypothetical protein